ncbi:MAG: SusD/RagB family nutrient-binding outer membrane lipoprotein [Candidatus Dadabacteria bacterium]
MKISIKQILPIALLVVLSTSCKKQLLDINVSPNDPTTASATPGVVLPAALATTAAIFNNPTADSRMVWAAIWMGHISYSGNYAISTESLSYAITNTFGGTATFNSIYDNIEDYDFVEQAAIKQGNKFYEGIGKLMKAYDFQYLVDLYGDVPYTEALKGTENSTPKYDKGIDIYTDLAKKMDEAIAIFKAATGTVSGDIMFNGDATKWLKFANTVKLRLLIRQSERTDRASYIQTQLANIKAGPFIDFDVTVQPGYLNSAGKQNPFWGSNVNVSGTYTQDLYRGGGFVIDWMKANNDPRLARLFKPAASTGVFTGNYFGEQGIPNSKTSEFGPGVLKSAGQASILMLAAESYFLQAEAALRGWIPGDAQALYQKGVEASFVTLGLSVAQAQAYYNQAGNTDTNWATASTFQQKLALIIRQKWAALTLVNELEAFNDYRRLHMPADIPLSRSPYSTGKVPSRIPLPQREYEVNAVNAPVYAVTDKVWWMP